MPQTKDETKKPNTNFEEKLRFIHQRKQNVKKPPKPGFTEPHTLSLSYLTHTEIQFSENNDNAS